MRARSGSISGRTVSQPATTPPTADDAWLHRACTVLTGGKLWNVKPHHRARMLHFLSAFRDDSLRRLAWSAALQYDWLLEESNIPLRPMPPHIATAEVVIHRLDIAIESDGRHFTMRAEHGTAGEMYVRSVDARYSSTAGAYRLPVTAPGVASVRKLAGEYGFRLTPSATAAIAEHDALSQDLAALSRAPSAEFAVEGMPALHPYQRAGVSYLAQTKRAFLCDDMGLGKTLQALATVQHLQAWPCIVVTLATVKAGWQAECTRWLPGVAVQVWSGKKDSGEAANKLSTLNPQLSTLHIINYDILPARLDELKALGAQSVIFDESHCCKNGKSARTVAARELAKRKPVRLLLTGTPSDNTPQELLPQLQMLGRLDDIGGFEHFVTRFLNAKRKSFGKGKVGWDFSGAHHLPELHEKLRATCFLRRTKDQVQTELPDTVVTRVPIPLSADGIAHYKAAQRDVKAWLAAKAPLRAEFLRSIAHLPEEERLFRQSQEQAEAVERLDGMELLHQFGALRRAVLEAKLPALIEWMLHHSEGDKLVLFGHHRTGLRDLAPALAAARPLIIDGETPVNKRAGIVKAFTEKPEHRILLANFQAAGTGLDGLQHAACHVVCAEWPWTPGTLRQAISRLHRQGQKKTVFQWHLTAPGTIDDESLDLLSEKATTADTITDGTPAATQKEAFTRARKLALNL